MNQDKIFKQNLVLAFILVLLILLTFFFVERPQSISYQPISWHNLFASKQQVLFSSEFWNQNESITFKSSQGNLKLKKNNHDSDIWIIENINQEVTPDQLIEFKKDLSALFILQESASVSSSIKKSIEDYGFSIEFTNSLGHKNTYQLGPVQLATGNFWIKKVVQSPARNDLKPLYLLVKSDLNFDGVYKTELDKNIQSYYQFLQYFSSWYPLLVHRPLLNFAISKTSFHSLKNDLYVLSWQRSGTTLVPILTPDLLVDENLALWFKQQMEHWMPSQLELISEEELLHLRAIKSLGRTFSDDQGQQQTWWLALSGNKENLIWNEELKLKAYLSDKDLELFLTMKEFFYQKAYSSILQYFKKSPIAPLNLTYKKQKFTFFWNTSLHQMLDEHRHEVADSNSWRNFMCLITACHESAGFLKADHLNDDQVKVFKKLATFSFTLGLKSYWVIAEPMRMKLLGSDQSQLTYIFRSDAIDVKKMF